MASPDKIQHGTLTLITIISHHMQWLIVHTAVMLIHCYMSEHDKILQDSAVEPTVFSGLLIYLMVPIYEKLREVV